MPPTMLCQQCHRQHIRRLPRIFLHPRLDLVLDCRLSPRPASIPEVWSYQIYGELSSFNSVR